MRQCYLIVLGACVVLIVGCGGDTPLATTTVPVAIVETATTSASATVTATSSPTASPTAPAPTSTPAPTATASPVATPDIAPEAEAYIDEALGLILEHSVFRDRLEPDAARATAMAMAAGATAPSDAWAGVRYLIRLLNDPHSYSVEPGLDLLADIEDPHLKIPEGQRLENGIGYFVVPEIRSGEADRQRYTAAGIDTIRAIDEEPVCGWIVDLRDNRGGRAFTMLLAVGPILGNGEIGSYTMPGNGGEPGIWFLNDGQAGVDGDVWVEGPAYTLQQPWPPVAVLHNRSTGSAGELVAIAFRGRPDTRSFGQPTAGAPTAPSGYELSDGAVLVLAMALMTDRTGEAFDGPIPPDVQVSGVRRPGNLDADQAVQAALEWLLSHPACNAP